MAPLLTKSTSFNSAASLSILSFVIAVFLLHYLLFRLIWSSRSRTSSLCFTNTHMGQPTKLTRTKNQWNNNFKQDIPRDHQYHQLLLVICWMKDFRSPLSAVGLIQFANSIILFNLTLDRRQYSTDSGE